MLTIDNPIMSRGVRMVNRNTKGELLALLRGELCSTASLREMCRGKIHEALGGKGIVGKVRMLNVPLAVRHYLMFDTDCHLDLSC